LPLRGIKPANKQSVSEDVFQQMITQVINRTWTPKSKIPSENALCKAFNVSRISIRSALNRLNALGIIETRQGEGSFIKGDTSDILMNPLLPRIVLDTVNLLDIMEYRKIIECGTVALDIDRVKEHDLLKLETIIREMERFQKEAAVFAIWDFKFHVELAKISGNSVILKVIDLLQSILQESVTDMIPLVGPESAIYYHRQVLDALRQKDKDKALAAMSQHIDSNIIRLKEQLFDGST